jgi:hypothetical protein
VCAVTCETNLNDDVMRCDAHSEGGPAAVVVPHPSPGQSGRIVPALTNTIFIVVIVIASVVYVALVILAVLCIVRSRKARPADEFNDKAMSERVVPKDGDTKPVVVTGGEDDDESSDKKISNGARVHVHVCV